MLYVCIGCKEVPRRESQAGAMESVCATDGCTYKGMTLASSEIIEDPNYQGDDLSTLPLEPADGPQSLAEFEGADLPEQSRRALAGALWAAHAGLVEDLTVNLASEANQWPTKRELTQISIALARVSAELRLLRIPVGAAVLEGVSDGSA